MNDILITVVTVCYNAVTSLENTIRSVLGQSYSNIEYIVIDGGSNDGTKEVIERYAKHLSYWVSEPDSGIYDAMNKAIAKASGDWIVFMNAGDFFIDQDVVSNVIPYLDESVSIFHGNIVKVYDYHKEKGCQLGKEKIDLVDFFYGTIDHQAAFIRRTLFEEYGYYDTSYQLAADWLFFMKVIGIHHEPHKYVNMDIAYFQMDGKSTKYSDRYEEERTAALRAECGAYYDYLKELSEYRLSSLITRLLRLRIFLRSIGVLSFLKSMINMKIK